MLVNWTSGFTQMRALWAMDLVWCSRSRKLAHDEELFRRRRAVRHGCNHRRFKDKVCIKDADPTRREINILSSRNSVKAFRP